MVNDELLYELLDEVSGEESLIIENALTEESSCNKTVKKMVMSRIYAEPEGKKRKVVSFKKKFVLAVASVFMVFGVMACARKYDWDIEFAQMLGFPNAMEELKGGYVKIGATDKQGDIEITAVQALGDKHNQWIQFDTNILWEVEEGGYYQFEEYKTDITHFNNSSDSRFSTFYSYENNGYVSFLLYASESGRINRASMKVTLGKIYQCDSLDAEKVYISDGTWELKWSNYYVANTTNKYPFQFVGDCLVSKVELSPISVRVEAVCKYSKETRTIKVDNIIMDDGTVIECNNTGSSNSNGIFLATDGLLDTTDGIDITKVKSVTINGIVIDI